MDEDYIDFVKTGSKNGAKCSCEGSASKSDSSPKMTLYKSPMNTAPRGGTRPIGLAISHRELPLC